LPFCCRSDTRPLRGLAAYAVYRVPRVTRLVLINGAPGAGKSTLAESLVQDQPMALALDVDGIKHSLGRRREDLLESGMHARRLSIALAREHLSLGHDVVLGQYLARTSFIEDLARLAAELDVQFFEFVLDLDASTLAGRLADRSRSPSRAEHLVNTSVVGPGDADLLVRSLESLRTARPQAVWIDARGSLASTLDLLRAALA
jgi:predicted kinase